MRPRLFYGGEGGVLFHHFELKIVLSLCFHSRHKRAGECVTILHRQDHFPSGSGMAKSLDELAGRALLLT
jgi:hypothetical protein